MGPNNEIMVANAPSDLETLRETLSGLPLGITPSGEVGIKMILIGGGTGVSAGINDIPQEDPHVKGLIWNNNGTPTISQG